jgi:hypothetical protein
VSGPTVWPATITGVSWHAIALTEAFTYPTSCLRLVS